MIKITCVFVVFLCLTVSVAADDDVFFDSVMFIESPSPSPRQDFMSASYLLFREVSGFGFTSPLVCWNIRNKRVQRYFCTNRFQEKILVEPGYAVSENEEVSRAFELKNNYVSTSYFDYKLNRMLASMLKPDFDMKGLNNAGLVLGKKLSGLKVVTFVNSGFEEKTQMLTDELIKRMAYAYILFHEGVPSVSFYDFFTSLFLSDALARNKTALVVTDLGEELQDLIVIRKTYIEGETDILTENGYPDPPEDTEHVYVARRGGDYYDGRHTNLPGAILVLNNHPTEAATIWVSTGGKLYKPWQGLCLVNLLEPIGSETNVQHDGRVQLKVAAQDYSIYVPKGDSEIFLRYLHSKASGEKVIKSCLTKKKVTWGIPLERGVSVKKYYILSH